MSNVVKLSPCIKPLHITRPMSFNHSITMKPNFMRFNSEKIHLISGDEINDIVKAKAVASYYSEQGTALDHDSPFSVQLEPIPSETRFHQVVDEAQQLQQSLVILWMASWCRKCIYLKPKLEKLAADYYPSIRFFCVDVENFSHKLLARAEVTKMPSIQLWNAGEKQAEVIGSHKAYFVVNQVREMIENEDSSL